MSRLPQLIQQGFLASSTPGGGNGGIVSIVVFLFIGLLTILGIVFIYQAQRRVPVRYPVKRMVGHVKWLASAALWTGTYLANTSLWYYWLTYFALVVVFTYFYAYVVWHEQNISENMQKQGTFIPGYRPGEPTRKYLSAIPNRIALGGALFLGMVAILPFVARVGGNQLLSSAALLIVVGVVLDTVKQPLR